MKALDAVSDVFEKVGQVLATLILAAVFCLVFFGVIFRITNVRFAMYEELSRWGMVGMTFIGASVALKRKLHIGVNMLVQHIPAAIARTCIIVGHLVVMFVMILSAYYSFRVALGAQGTRGDIVPLSMMYIKFSLPIGFFMMFAHLIANFAHVFKAKDINEVLIGS